MEERNTLETAEWFSDLISGKTEPPLLKRFRRFEINSVIDIGCGTGQALLNMYYALGTAHLEGIDYRSEREIVEDVNAGSKTAFTDLKDIWLSSSSSTYDVRPLITDRQQISELMANVHHNMDAHHYRPSREQFDAVILSQVLHTAIESRAKYMLKMAEDLCKPGGLIFISIKDGFDRKHPEMIGSDVLIALCDDLHERLKGWAVVRTYGRVTRDEGQCIIYSNL